MENKPKEAIKQGGIGVGVAAGGIVGSVVADNLDEEFREFTTWKIN